MLTDNGLLFRIRNRILRHISGVRNCEFQHKIWWMGSVAVAGILALTAGVPVGVQICAGAYAIIVSCAVGFLVNA